MGPEGATDAREFAVELPPKAELDNPEILD
jgi:hypothetical protein